MCDRDEEEEDRDWCWVEDMADDDIVVGEVIGAFILECCELCRLIAVFLS